MQLQCNLNKKNFRAVLERFHSIFGVISEQFQISEQIKNRLAPKNSMSKESPKKSSKNPKKSLYELWAPRGCASLIHYKESQLAGRIIVISVADLNGTNWQGAISIKITRNGPVSCGRFETSGGWSHQIEHTNTHSSSGGGSSSSNSSQVPPFPNQMEGE